MLTAYPLSARGLVYRDDAGNWGVKNMTGSEDFSSNGTRTGTERQILEHELLGCSKWGLKRSILCPSHVSVVANG